MIVNMPLAFLIPSSSGHAALAMPLLAPLADFAEVSRATTITAWITGHGLTLDVLADQRGRGGWPRDCQGRLRPLPALRLATGSWACSWFSATIVAIAAELRDEPVSDAAISLLILAITVALFVWNRYPVEVVAIGSALALYATGVITFDQSSAASATRPSS